MESSSMLPLLGRDFMAAIGAVVNMQNGMISFANTDEKVFYIVVPTQRYSSSYLH